MCVRRQSSHMGNWTLNANSFFFELRISVFHIRCIKLITVTDNIAGPDLQEYCQWETFNASCGSDEVILMHSARYGRMRFGRCMKEDHGSAGCAAVVLPQLDRKCSARRVCHLPIPDASMHSIHPCPKELMPYLEASYSCITGKNVMAEYSCVASKKNDGWLVVTLVTGKYLMAGYSCNK